MEIHASELDWDSVRDSAIGGQDACLSHLTGLVDTRKEGGVRARIQRRRCVRDERWIYKEVSEFGVVTEMWR